MGRKLSIVYLIMLVIWLVAISAFVLDVNITSLSVIEIMLKIIYCLSFLIGIALVFAVINTGEVPFVAYSSLAIFTIGIIFTFVGLGNETIEKIFTIAKLMAIAILIIFSIQSKSDTHFKFKVTLAINTVALIIYLTVFNKLISYDLGSLLSIDDSKFVYIWLFITLTGFMANPAIACLSDFNNSSNDRVLPGPIMIQNQQPVQPQVAPVMQQPTVTNVFDNNQQ